MIKARVITPWIGKGETLPSLDSYRPMLMDNFQVKWVDVTRQPAINLSPDPNLYIIEVSAEAEVLDAIDEDDNYEILWREDDKDDSPPANAFGKIRSRLAQAGVSQQEITQVIGNGAQGRSRAEIATILRDWFATRPKAQ